MDKKFFKLYFLTLILSLTLVLSSCDGGDLSEYSDTLPTTKATTTISTTEEISEVATPIEIDVPETTATTTRKTETATTTETTSDAETTTESTTQITTSTDAETTTEIPTVASNYMDTTIPEPSISTIKEVTTKKIPETQTFDPSLLTYDKYSDGPYIFEDPIPRSYAYYELDEQLRKLYDLVFESIDDYVEGNIIVPADIDVTAKDYENIYEMIYNDEYRLFGIDTTFKYMENSRTGRLYSFEITYKFSKSELTRMKKETEENADKIIAKITPDMTKYDIVKFFYDEIAQGCTYDSSAPNLRNIYGVFVEKRAVCGGIAKAFTYLCDKVGIKSLTITGDDGDTPHLWNMVELGGEWYHIDPTNGVMLNNGKIIPKYDYFCITDADIVACRTIYPVDYSYPVANSVKYNYYYYNNLIINDTSSNDVVYDFVVNLIKEASKTQKNVVSFSMDNKENYDKVCDILFNSYNYNLINLLYDNQENFAYRVNTGSINYFQNEKTRTITFVVEYL